MLTATPGVSDGAPATSTERAPWESNDLEYAITHIFLPGESRDGSGVLRNAVDGEDKALVYHVACAAVHAYATEIDNTAKPPWRHLTEGLKKLHTSLRSVRPSLDQVVSQLREMEPGAILLFMNAPGNTAVVLAKHTCSTLYVSYAKPQESMPQELPAAWGVDIADSVFLNRYFCSEFVNLLLHPNGCHTLLSSIVRGVGRDIRVPHIFSNHYKLAVPCRSFVWLLIKVAISMSLDQGDSGRFRYKVFILRFMCNLAKDALGTDMSSHLLHAISCKILRRLEKLGSSAPNWLHEMVLHTNLALRETLEARWTRMQVPRHPPCLRQLSLLDLDMDTVFSLRTSEKYIQCCLTKLDSQSPEFPFVPPIRFRYTLDDFLCSYGSALEKEYDIDPYTALYDVEQSVEQGIDGFIASVVVWEDAYIQLKHLLRKYLSKARDVYKGDAELISVMLLTGIELWVALDKLIIEAVPSLADYSPDVSAHPLCGLLLRTPTQLHRLCRVHQYLASRNSHFSSQSVFSEECATAAFDIRPYIISLEEIHCPEVTEPWTTISPAELHDPSSLQLRQALDRRYPIALDRLDPYINTTSHTSNEVLAAQIQCPRGLSAHEFIAIGHLRSGGSLQWLNILRELRSRSLDFRRHDVHFLLAKVASQVGPFDLNSARWEWHQELEEPSFLCSLLDELESFLVDVALHSQDGVMMNSISLLLSRLLASRPREDISDRIVGLLRRVRKKTLDWVRELSYDLTMAPTNKERKELLSNMAATCRSTFNVGPDMICKHLCSAEDIATWILCGILIHASRNIDSTDIAEYSRLILQRDRRLSLSIENVLGDVIKVDASNRGIDIAVRDVWPGYRPSPRTWEPLNFCWLLCTTATIGRRCSQIVHLSPLDGTLLVDGYPIDGLPDEIREHTTYRRLFSDKRFYVVPSDLPGMDFCTLAMIYEHKVHFALGPEGNLVIRAQYQDAGDILEVIPHEILQADLPTMFIDDHVHWLNLSTSVIEIRPLKLPWQESTENWRINCNLGQCRIYKGHEWLVDILSPTYALVSTCLDCLDACQNMIITTLPMMDTPNSSGSRRLSATLPRYGLSFFINENEELESRDYDNMVYDEKQSIGTLFGLENQLVLRPKRQVEGEFIHKCVIIPHGQVSSTDTGVTIDEATKETFSMHPIMHQAYRVDTDLGCLSGDGSWASKLHLARLHFETSTDWMPDPLIGRTGTEQAMCLLQSADGQSIIGLDINDGDSHHDLGPHYTLYPQIQTSMEKIQYHARRMSFLSGCGPDIDRIPPGQPNMDMLRTAHSFPFTFRPARPIRVCSNSKPSLEDLAYSISLAVYHQLVKTEDCTEARDNALEDNSWEDYHSRFPRAIAEVDAFFWRWQDPWVYRPEPKFEDLPPSLGELADALRSHHGSQRFKLLFLLPAVAYCFTPLWRAEVVSFSIFCALSLQVLLTSPHDSAHDHWRNSLYSSFAFRDSPQVVLSFSAFQESIIQEKLNTILTWSYLSPRRYLNFVTDITSIDHLPKHHCLSLSSPSSLQRPNSLAQACYHRVTLCQLFHDRSPPTLPPPCPLKHKLSMLSLSSNYHSTHTLDQLFSSLRMKETDLAFRKEYITHLHVSARYARETPCIPDALTSGPSIAELREYYVQCKEDYIGALRTLKRSLGPLDRPLGQALQRSDQWPKITPDALLRCLATASPIKPPDAWKKCLIALALLLIQLQRSRRLLRFALEDLKEEFRKELENEGCCGWCAEEYPDWLLIEIQGNFLIRRDQAEAALHMISPPFGQNTAIQVSMGEGKSSVILPISAAILADGEQLVRVIVPQAFTVQMFRLLADRLGGLVNRPIYHIPFSRSLASRYSRTQVGVLGRLLAECIRNRGILVVQPEHLLSLRLSSLEQYLSEDLEDVRIFNNTDANNERSASGSEEEEDDSEEDKKESEESKDKDESEESEDKDESEESEESEDEDERKDKGREEISEKDLPGTLHELQKWMHSRSRDIIDEIDHILHPRFQLIYTIGRQQHLQGFPDRWIIIQQVLRLVRKHALSLSYDLPNAIEYERNTSGSFPRIRILHVSDARQRLISLIIDDIVNGRLPTIRFQDIDRNQRLRAAIRDFISCKNVPQWKAGLVKEYGQQTGLWDGILLLRGLLAWDVLLFALAERRWRVDYGLSPARTEFAVPYQAKDMPSARAEFGQPDVAILLTCLSYYYGGLTEKQLRTSFEILQEQDDPYMEYEIWLQDYEPASVPEFIQDLKNVNTKPSELWDKYLYPLFARNQGAVDFYLSRVVFPKEAQDFPQKLEASSCDLAEIRDHPTTGVSGTNDSQYLLPMSITQHDLDHQRGSNARVLSHLLQPENNSYMVISHPNGERRTTIELLEIVVKQEPKVHVFLDVGAQILDLSNYQLAKVWLDLSPNYDGAVHFNEANELMVLTKYGVCQPLRSSPLAQRLDHCFVYLDEGHTRGTDLKLPRGSRAAVTLGPKVTKDRLVQGCMRMRKLGHGHSILFLAPLEVDRDIRSVAGKEDENIPVATTDILRWAIQETWTDVQQRAPSWAQQCINHDSRYHSWSHFCNDELTIEQLSKAWVKPEYKSLSDLYDPFQPKNASSWSSVSLDDYPEIQHRCEDLGVLQLPHLQMDEEQEREVHREVEKEREPRNLPSIAKPVKHFLHPGVISLVKTGVIPKLHGDSAFLPISQALKRNFTLADTMDACVWSPSFLATSDFCNTVHPASHRDSMNSYLRPVEWVLSANGQSGRVLVVLSPFEASQLMPDIRASKHVHLHVYTPRTSMHMKPTDDLRFYSIPPVPHNWTPPRDLVDELNVFSGQLYLRDYESFLRLSRYLGIQNREVLKDVGTAVRRNLVTSSILRRIGDKFAGSPLPSVLKLLVVRRRGVSFATSHMGRILQGERLSEKDFSTAAASGELYDFVDRGAQMLPLTGSMGSSSPLSSQMSQGGWKMFNPEEGSGRLYRHLWKNEACRVTSSLSSRTPKRSRDEADSCESTGRRHKHLRTK